MSVITKHHISYNSLERALTSPEAIAKAFSWASTFQGFYFWEEFALGKTTPEKTEEIKALLRLELMLHKGVALEVTQKELEELL